MSNVGVSIVMDLVNRISGPAKSVGASIGRVSSELGKASDQAVKAARSMRDLEASYDKMQKRLETSQRLSFVGAEMTKMGRGLTAPLKSAAGTAMEFEERMSAVGAVTQASAEDLQKLESAAKTWGSTTQFSAIQAAEGMRFMGMTGASTNEVLQGMPHLLDAAKAGGMDLARTSDIATNILSGFRMEMSEMQRVTDALAAASTSSNATIEQLGESMKYVAPIAAEAGVSLETATAMTGMLGDAGIQGSMAGTVMRGMLSKLSDPAADASSLLQKLNVDLVDMDGNLRNPVTVLGELATAMDGMGSGDRLAALNTIFDTRAAAGMAALMDKEGSGGITKFVEALENAEGAAATLADQMADNTKGGLIGLQSATEGLSIAFGDVLLPVIDAVSGMLTGLTRWVTKLSKSNNWLAKGVALLLAVFGGLAMALGGLFSTMSGLMGSWAATAFALDYLKTKGLLASFSFKKLGLSALSAGKRVLAFAGGAIKSAAVGIWGFATTTLPAAIAGMGTFAATAWAAMVPFLPLIAVVALLAGAAFLIVKYWEPIKGFFIRMWGGIKAGALAFWEALKTNPFFNPIGYVRANWGKISTFMQGTLQKIGGMIKEVFDDSLIGKGIKVVSWVGEKVARLAGKGATAGAMASAAVAGPLASPAMMSGQTPIEQTIARNQVSNASSQVNAPITINAAAGQDPAAIAQAIRSELDARDRQAQARNRGRLYD